LGIMVHGKHANPIKNIAPMIRYHSHKQLSLADFDWPFQTALDENNRRVKMSQCIPWDALQKVIIKASP
jgi:IS5 family transposase